MLRSGLTTSMCYTPRSDFPAISLRIGNLPIKPSDPRPKPSDLLRPHPKGLSVPSWEERAARNAKMQAIASMKLKEEEEILETMKQTYYRLVRESKENLNVELARYERTNRSNRKSVKNDENFTLSSNK